VLATKHQVLVPESNELGVHGGGILNRDTLELLEALVSLRTMEGLENISGVLLVVPWSERLKSIARVEGKRYFRKVEMEIEKSIEVNRSEKAEQKVMEEKHEEERGGEKKKASRTE